ncbi:MULTISPECIES: aspartate aminotransferase family protein [unclassified Pseudomonas]|uniref:aspartate aminotransferase family protein n=1 Tax=unclassified Pseudomonas TaxID=196821 RepID=UPI000BC68B6D|nr:MULTISPECIES: aminotransferase class III-fold pyridoxal phosphate-dependent enzyme [unclassified Pseudomonas]PVZ15697.1 acetylornithine/N-succinyldiaminopimelate aminotransferase [Pseudomonas sp. URIL14HWK12:I12]PVZ25071.1 acetylornithine/N-succinyldiaminopimelate aminotransferase [Pseudomonas sp. URIL14HWK12:I10]PVZ34917.1 acetylornithine/N-succinyldiaminopimelate aminotransferase [Pseudomonas sp. URIL14HWK12:I11]SNZ09659.1 acetylornithine/N-succinyldiaminopimelate aminotransferase [Pseudom
MSLFSLAQRPAEWAGFDAKAARGHRLQSSTRPERVFVRGQGSWLWDDTGRAYLDFTQGLGVNSLGHSPSALVEALQAQARELVNPGARWEHQGELALLQQLCRATESDFGYLLGTGSEACEAAVLLARQWGETHRRGAFGIITAQGGCHGHGLGARSSTARLRHGPGLQGFTQVPFNDLPALCAAINTDTVAIMLEPVQGEAGVRPAEVEYLQGVERLCRELGILLILDEVGTGVGRCGTMLAEQHYQVRADILTLGKGLGGGVGLAAVLTRERARALRLADFAGSHHGNPLACAAGRAVLQAVPELLGRVDDRGRHLRDGLSRLAQRYGLPVPRGLGLLWGLPLPQSDAAQVASAALQEGLLLDAPQADALRFTPALCVSRGNIDDMLARLGRALARVRTAQLGR